MGEFKVLCHPCEEFSQVPASLQLRMWDMRQGKQAGYAKWAGTGSACCHPVVLAYILGG